MGTKTEQGVSQEEEWDRLLRSIVSFQARFGRHPVVGGTAAAIHVGHRLSFDADYVLGDLREKYEEVLDSLEGDARWTTARTAFGKLILGSFENVETGLRQLRRAAPLETTEVETGKGRVVIPTLEEMIRIKGWLILVRNTVRDHLDFAALTDAAGEDRTLAALGRFDDCYRDVDVKGLPRGTSPVLQLARQLSQPEPKDLPGMDLSQYKGVSHPWNEWGSVATQCRMVCRWMRTLVVPSTQRVDPDDDGGFHPN